MKLAKNFSHKIQRTRTSHKSLHLLCIVTKGKSPFATPLSLRNTSVRLRLYCSSPFHQLQKRVMLPFQHTIMLLPTHSVPTATKKTEPSEFRSQMNGKTPIHILLLLSAILVLLPLAGAAPWRGYALVGDLEDFGMGPPICPKRPDRRLRERYIEI